MKKILLLLLLLPISALAQTGPQTELRRSNVRVRVTSTGTVEILTGGSLRWTIDASGNLVLAQDAVFNFGSGSFRWNNGFFGGTVTANLFSGPGGSITGMNASNLASGTIPDARFPAVLPAMSGLNLTNINASNLASGTVGTARLGTGTANSTTFLRGDGAWAADSPSFSLTGTGGLGFLQLANQSSAPASPTDSGRLFFDSTNRLSWKGTNGFVRTFDGTANTADRAYVLPDTDGNVVVDVAPQPLENKTIVSPTNIIKNIRSFHTVASLPATCTAPSTTTGFELYGRTSDNTLHVCVATNTFAQVWASNINPTATYLNSSFFCSDAGANDTYACALSPAIAAYTTGNLYWFKANTANTGAATINLNALGAKTIKKAVGGITTDLADNDIRAGQWVMLMYDGTNMQMQSTFGNAPSGGSGATVPSGGYLLFPSRYPVASNTAGTTSANGVECIRSSLSENVTVDKLAFSIGTAVGGGLASVAVYSDDGNTKILDAGAQSAATVGAISVTPTGAGATLTAGVHYNFCYTNDNTTSSPVVVQSNPTGTLLLSDSQTTTFFAANASAAGVMPATLGAPTGNNNAAAVLIMFRKN